MKKAIFYHTIIRGGPRNINTDYALVILCEQLMALKDSGLMDASEEFYIGVNGDESDAMMISQIAGNKAKVVCNGKGAVSEIPTMKMLRSWLPGHEEWAVLYHQMKSVSTQGQADGWRHRMERNVVWNWRDCIGRLESGVETCGSHWLTPEQFPGAVTSPFWGGTFWWARASYLLSLPPLPDDTWGNRYEAESWIGRASRRARVHDYCPGWPSTT